MKEIVERKLKELYEKYTNWLEEYDRDGYSYQEQIIDELRAKISILNEVLKESEK